MPNPGASPRGRARRRPSDWRPRATAFRRTRCCWRSTTSRDRRRPSTPRSSDCWPTGASFTATAPTGWKNSPAAWDTASPAYAPPPARRNSGRSPHSSTGSRTGRAVTPPSAKRPHHAVAEPPPSRAPGCSSTPPGPCHLECIQGLEAAPTQVSRAARGCHQGQSRAGGAPSSSAGFPRGHQVVGRTRDAPQAVGGRRHILGGQAARGVRRGVPGRDSPSERDRGATAAR